MTREELMNTLRKANLPELEYRATEYWDDEDQKHEGLTDAEYLLREAEWVVEDFTEDTGHCLHDEWLEAKATIKRTKNGKFKQIALPSFEIMEGWRDSDVKHARELLDEVKRTKAFIRKLRRMV